MHSVWIERLQICLLIAFLLPCSAKLKVEDATRAEIRFEIWEANGAWVQNTATLSSDGQKLLGTTKARVKNGAAWVAVSYGWIAERSE